MAKIFETATFDNNSGEMENLEYTPTFKRQSALMRLDVLMDVMDALEMECDKAHKEWVEELKMEAKL